MRKFRNIAISLLFVVTLTIILSGLYYNINLSAVDTKNKNQVIVNINKLSNREIGKLLKEKNLIKNDTVFVMYLRFNGINNLKSGTYDFNQSMSVKDIVSLLQKGSNESLEEVNLTFREGLNIRQMADIIDNQTDNSKDDVFNLLKDEKYIDNVVNKYWFLTDSIKNKDIYYPLEGYLFPNTYRFKKSASVEEIFDKILNQTDKVLSKYKNSIEKSNKSIHDILTMASIIEIETSNKSDRKIVSSVFYNRLSTKMSLGSDVTAYYAVKKNLSKIDLTKKEYNTYNPYNTRGPKMEGKLPVGPVSNPSESSIDASINPSTTDYTYFFADITTGKTYFTKSYQEHLNVVNKFRNADKN